MRGKEREKERDRERDKAIEKEIKKKETKSWNIKKFNDAELFIIIRIL